MITLLDYGNEYCNLFNAITAMAVVIAIYVSFRAIRISVKDSSKQILAYKVEEIYELVVVLYVVTMLPLFLFQMSTTFVLFSNFF